MSSRDTRANHLARLDILESWVEEGEEEAGTVCLLALGIGKDIEQQSPDEVGAVVGET